MKAILKREFKSYFNTVIGWIFLAAFFFIFDLYFVADCMIYGYPYIAYPLGSVEFIFIIIIPILAMRSMAEERRTKTDQLLYTSPVSVPRVIIGKYLSMVSVLSIAMGAVCLCPLLLSAFGSVPFGQSYTVILGIWLFACLAIAISMFISSITESQVIAAVLSFALLFLGYMMDSIISLVSSGSNILTKILGCLSITAPLENFESGILDLSGIVYYVSGAALFIFLVCQIVQKHRWSTSSKKIKKGVFNAGLIVIGLAIVVAVNILVSALPTRIKDIDLTDQKLYSLTDETDSLLDELKDDIVIYVLKAEDEADEVLSKTLENYESRSSHITVEYVDTDASPEFYTEYTDSAPTDNSLIVVCEDRSRSKVVDFDNIYQYDIDYYSYSYSITGYDGEGQITSAINYVISDDTKKVYMIDGHGESPLDNSFVDALEKYNISLDTITLLTYDDVPDDAAAVIINGPTSDFSRDDAKKITKYLGNGGKALITTSYAATEDMTNFESILEEYDIEFTEGIVMEDDTSYYYQYAFYLLPEIEYDDLTSGVDGYIFAPYAQKIDNLDSGNEDLVWDSLLITSDSAYLKTDVNSMTYTKEDGDETGPFIIGAHVSDTSSGAEVSVIATSLLFTDDADSIVSGENLALFKGIAGTFSDSDISVPIDVKQYSLDYLIVSQAVIIIMELLLVVVLPIAMMVLGIVIWFRRRR